MATESFANILVVDDNPAGRYATARVLKSAGFSILEASNGAEAIDLSSSADLVILDVNLPDISGFDVCRKIRSTASTSRIPVIHLSATFVQDTDKVQGLEAGADGYLTHPVEPPVLIATVNAFLRTRRAEDEMRRSEAKFKAIFDQAMSGIVLVSKDLVFLEANPSICKMLARPREEIVGRHLSAFVPTEREQETFAAAADVEKRGTWHGTLPLIRADKTHVELEWSIAHHSVPGMRLAIVNDVTERRAHEIERERLLGAERNAREEAERANRLKDEFLATLSHELRTPLNAIVGWAQILKQGDATPADLSEGIDAIDRNAQSQVQLIADLLDVSRIVSGNLRLDVRAINPLAPIEAAIETMMPAIDAKQIKLQRNFDPTIGLISGDPDRLQQVIWNLINNAVKFTPKHGTIGVTLSKERSQIVIAVADNGQGIKSEFLPHIFERFRQENASTRRNQGGLGLGLAIVKNLVEMHGGTIVAQSDGEGRGASFTVTLPIAAVRPPSVEEAESTEKAYNEASPTLPSDSAPAPLPVSLNRTRILIVEDDADARAVLSRVLAGYDAEVFEAVDVPSAMKAIAEFDPQILISDVGIPGQDGYDLIRAARTKGYTKEKLPAIALTAFARTEDRAKSLHAGFQIHLAKPVRTDELLVAVASFLRS
jgi:PAS domain S-box-containing protein